MKQTGAHQGLLVPEGVVGRGGGLGRRLGRFSQVDPTILAQQRLLPFQQLWSDLKYSGILIASQHFPRIPLFLFLNTFLNYVCMYIRVHAHRVQRREGIRSLELGLQMVVSHWTGVFYDSSKHS